MGQFEPWIGPGRVLLVPGSSTQYAADKCLEVLFVFEPGESVFELIHSRDGIEAFVIYRSVVPIPGIKLKFYLMAALSGSFCGLFPVGRSLGEEVFQRGGDG